MGWKQKMIDRTHIGTSGWVYGHWKGRFYPEDLPQEAWLGYYAQQFDTVEINYSFYQLPSEKDFRTWEEQAPEGFLYAVKGNRYITHMKNLKASSKSVEKFTSRARLLKSHLGPILWQLPPHWHANPARLEAFAARLPDDVQHAFEFRDPDWFDDEIRSILERHAFGFVIYAMPGVECPHWVTSDLIYLRFHGVQGSYSGAYGEERLRPWAEEISSWAENGRTVHAYFNNDPEAHAVEDARTLISLLDP
jgi:uncharacterized protein YecE (DUF72 family)